ncbi:hypothetical protein DH2020_021451 [Rehmannia glutinosa]|uniref:Uncharacterized protein n=1 Tax=Rehmannia glutinosa TaxID=99300 RepID=A0ABR0WDI3_REHGL
MAGNARFESASPDSSFAGSYQSGQRGYSVPTLDRSTSFRETADSRNFASGKTNSREVLPLQEISEDNSFGAAHLKNSSPGAVEELKRLRASVADTCVKASASTLKIGSLIHRNPTEFGSQKLDDRAKNVGLNKRLRTSVAETRAECRTNGVLRQPLPVTKERDLLKDSNADSDIVEGKIRRLPAGGEGWDKKMKRKRSVGAVFSRSVDTDGELKRTMHHKLPNESSLQSSDSTHSFRSGASGSSNKLDPASSPVGSSARTSLKNEPEKSMLSRDLSAGPIKERTLGKVNVRMNTREDNQAMCPSPILKGKASRAPRSGTMVAANSASNVLRVSGTLESWEQPQAVTKTPTIGGTNNRKRSMPAGSSSPPITQWVGQRPQKISRTRRTNLIPVSTHDDVPMQSEGCSPSDFGPRLSTGGTNSSLPTKSSANGNQNSKVQPENVPSPARLSESEESGAGEIRMKEKGLVNGDGEEKDANSGQNVGSTAIPIKKNKIMVKEEVGDGVRRQGRSGRVSPFSRASISPTREKLDNVGPTKPQRNARSGSDKNGSKSGRPLKKLSDRKGFSRLGHMANGGSPDCSGESEDDREELIVAANLAGCSSFNACTSAFWKTVESLFASIGPDEKSFLSEQLKLAEESCTSSYPNRGHGNNVQVKLDDYGHEDIAAPDSLCFGGYRRMKNETGLKNSLDRMEFTEQVQTSSVFGCSETEKRCDIVTPLYQRVLSALIMEDEIEEIEENGFGRPRSSFNDSQNLIGAESKHIDKLDLCEPMFGAQTPKTGNAHIIFHVMEMRTLIGVLVPKIVYVMTNNCGISSFDCQYEQMCVEEKLILELQSVGLFMEAVPALDDKEDEMINEEIVQLERGLHEQGPEQIAMDKLVELAYKKLLVKSGMELEVMEKVMLLSSIKGILKLASSPVREAVGPNVFRAGSGATFRFQKWKRFLGIIIQATRGSFASKHGIAKVSKQVALGFAKRTLARCRKFEDSGASCFSDPALRDIIFASPPRFDQTELLLTDGRQVDAFESDQAFAKNGPISNRAKRKEVLLDDVGGAMFRASSALGILDGAKGKRSERDRDRNTVAKAGGRSSMGGSKGERKAKSKPKQKTAQLSTSAANTSSMLINPLASGSGESGNSSGNRKKDVRFMSSSGNVPPVEFANLPLNEIDGIEELGVDSEIGEPQDLNSWFNFDVDGLQDHDSVGLEIPMDDLAELNMF